MSVRWTSAPSRRTTWWIVAIVAGLIVVALSFTVVLYGFLLLFAGVLLGNFLYKLSSHLAQATRVAYGVAFAFVVLMILLLVSGTAVFMGTRISYQIAELSEQFGQARQELQQQIEALGWRRWVTTGDEDAGNAITTQRVITTAGSAVTMTLSTVASIVLVGFLGFYFALQAHLYRDGVVKLFAPRLREQARTILKIISRTLWWWVLGRLVGMTLIGTTTIIGLWALDIPLAITLGVIAGLLNFIPNIGPLLASIPPILFGLQQGINVALYVAGFYLVLQFIESYLITPLIDQQQVRLPPGLILAAQLMLGLLGGFLGLLLATPITAVIYVLVRELYVQRLLHGLEQPPPQPAEA